MFPELIYNGKPVLSPAEVDDNVVQCYIRSNEHARNYLMGIRADYSAGVSAIKSVTLSTSPKTIDGVTRPATLSRGGNFNVQHTDLHWIRNTITFYKASVSAGVALATGTIPADKWGVYLTSVSDSGTITSTPGAANFSTGYDSEALAIAALPATPAGNASIGRTTVLTASGLAFIGGTDALQGGTGGNVSDDTNFVSTVGNVLTVIETITRWDFAKGPMFLTLPIIYGSKFDQALSLELAASGTGGTTGRITAWVSAP